MGTVRTELLAAVYPEHGQGGVEYCAGAAGSGCVEGVGAEGCWVIVSLGI